MIMSLYHFNLDQTDGFGSLPVHEDETKNIGNGLKSSKVQNWTGEQVNMSKIAICSGH